MQESCLVLENQLEQCQRKASNHLDMETKLADYQNQIKQHLADIAEVYISARDHQRKEGLNFVSPRKITGPDFN